MWSFGNPKSSTAVIIITILLFAEMNAIASLKLQSFNNDRARRNPLTANTKCCPDIVRRRTKRFIGLRLWTRNNNFYFDAGISAIAAASVVGVIAAGLGFGAGLIGAGIGSFWKTATSSSQTVQAGAGIVLPVGSGTYYSIGGNNGQHHHYYYYLPPSYYYYYG